MSVRQFALPVALLLAFAVACHDEPTGPKPVISVLLNLTDHGGPWDSPSGGQRRLECRATFEARASGHDARALWEDASILFYAGPDRREPLDSVIVPASDVQQGWDATSIGPGETQTSSWQFFLSIPYAVKVNFRYRTAPGGETKTLSAQFSCGPEVPPGSAPPTISALSISPSQGSIEIGDNIDVTYATSTPLGVWRTVLGFNGGFSTQKLIDENLPTSITRTEHVAVPPSAAMGVKTIVTLTVTDGALQQRSLSIDVPLTVVDTRPPTFSTILWRRYGLVPGGPPSGEYAFGDTMVFDLGAGDARGVSAFIYELSGAANVRSELPTSGTTSASYRLRIPVEESWVGSATFRGRARDVTGLLSAEVVSPPDSIRFYPTVRRPNRTGTVDGEYSTIQIDSKRGKLYILGSTVDGPRVKVVTLATLAVESPMTLPEAGGDLDLSLSGDSLLVTLPTSRAVAVIDLTRPADAPRLVHLSLLDSTTYQPNGIRVAANGKAFVSTTPGPSLGPSRVVEIDLATGAQRFRSDAGVAGLARAGYQPFRSSLDRNRLAFVGAIDHSCIQIYRVETDAFDPCRAVFGYASDVFLDASGNRIAIGNAVYDGQLQLVKSFFGTGIYGRLIPTPSGAGLYFCDLVGIDQLRLSDGRLVERTPVTGGCALDRGVLSADGTTLAFVHSETFNSRPRTVVNVVEGLAER